MVSTRARPGVRARGWIHRWRERLQTTSEASEHPVTRSWVHAGDHRIFTRRACGGEATGGETADPVIVLVHGLGMSGLTFVPLMQRFAGRAQVWAPDLPGFGRSTAGGATAQRALELDELAEALAAWMGAADVRADCLVGHSLGAQIVAQLALTRPELVPRAVLVGPTRDPRVGSLLHQGLRMLKDLPREPFALARLAIRDYLSATPGRMVRTMHDAMDTRVRERARALDLPVLVIRGEHDPIVPADWAVQLRDLLPQGSLIEIPGAPHGSTYTHPGEVAELTLAFIRESSA